MLTFAHPALLLALPAALLPILIHLLLRTRPRRVRFPALALLQPAMREGRRATRVRRWWLLLVRMAVIAGLALLLAGPSCEEAGGSRGVEPIARVIVLDESGSMDYRLSETRRVRDEARQQCAALLGPGNWPPGMAADVLSTIASDASRLTTDREALRRRVPRGNPPESAATLVEALRRAAGEAREATQPQREIVILTDGAAHAWTDVSRAIFDGVSNLTVEVRLIDSPDARNLAITSAAGPGNAVAASAGARIRAAVNLDGLAGLARLTAMESERTLVQVALEPSNQAEREVLFAVPSLSAGLHGLELRLDPTDRLEFDQTRYLTLETGPRPLVWMVAGENDDDLSRLIFANLLAPESFPAERQVVDLRNIAPDRILGGLASGERLPALVLLMDDVDLPAAAVEELLRWTEGGGTLLLTPASRGNGAWSGAERPLLNAPARAEAFSTAATIEWTPQAAVSPSPEDELHLASVRRRIRIVGPTAGGVVEARYSTGEPAIISRTLGKGKIVLLTTSPDPTWSELGTRAAGLLVWLHQLAAHARSSAAHIGDFELGAQTRTIFESVPANGFERVVRDTQSSTGGPPEVTRVRMIGGAPEPAWPTDKTGLFRIMNEGGETVALYSVNWPTTESDLTPISQDRIRELLGPIPVRFVGTDDANNAQPANVLTEWLRQPRPVFAMAVLLLLLLEMMLALRAGGLPRTRTERELPPA